MKWKKQKKWQEQRAESEAFKTIGLWTIVAVIQAGTTAWAREWPECGRMMSGRHIVVGRLFH